MEGYQLVGNGFIVVSEAHINQIHLFAALKVGEVVVAEGTGDFTGAVRTEVVEDNGVVLLD